MTELIPEVIDINKVNSIDIVEINKEPETKPSINFGGGIELLMNDKRKENKTPTSDIDLEDISKLESELNELSDSIPKYTSQVKKSDLFKPISELNNNIVIDKEDTKIENKED